MTDRKQALIDLRDKVKEGDDAGFRLKNRAAFGTPCQDMALQLREEHCRYAYKGSLDAAKALHEAVIPGWSPSLAQNVHHKHWTATVMRAVDGVIVDDETAGYIDHPARAWLLAILEALIAQEPA